MMQLILAGPLDWLAPVGDVLRFPFEKVLGFLYNFFSALPVLNAIGAYGLAIIFLTIGVKMLLFPLFQTQLKITKKTQAEQRKVAPELAEIKKRHKGDPTRINAETMALYKKHDVNPFGQLMGCLPTLAQMPILIGLYQAIYQHHFLPHGANTHFLGLNLSISASLHDPVTWILPLLAGASTFVQSKMFTPPPLPEGEQDPQAAQMQQVSKSMSLLMPLMITFFAFQPLALQGLVLYWIVSNLFSIAQQYSVNGWGQLPILGNKPEPLSASSSNPPGSSGKVLAESRARNRARRGRRGGRK